MKRIALIAAVAVCLPGLIRAGESLQFRGPNRDGIFDETGLMKEWPAAGPPVAWVATGLGQGYSSVSVTKDAIYVPGMLGEDQGHVSVLDLHGKIVKQIAYGKETLDKQAPGPRSTPTIDGNRLYLMSGLGVVYCIQIPEGDLLWQVDVPKRFDAKPPQWTYAESLLVDGDRLICTPGGKDASVVALDKMTGGTVWTSKGLSDQASYCSAYIVELEGRRLLLTMTAKYVVGLDADTGEPLWTHEHPTDYDIHAVAPRYADGMLYYTGGYKSGGGMLELSADGASITPKWTDKTLDCQHHGVILLDGYLYGTGHGSAKELLCLELKTGEIAWRTKEVTQGAVVMADGMLYVYEGPKRGVVSLVKATHSGYERSGLFKVSEGSGNHWAHPTIAGKRLYIRHGGALIAYDIAAK